MKVFNLTSGSSGNSTYVETGGSKILVDCGISAHRAASQLRSIEVDPDSIDSILLTHEHIDHSRGIFTFARRHNVPLYVNFSTLSAVKGNMKKVDIHYFKTGCRFTLGDLDILPFHTYHDAADPVGFRFFNDEGDIVIATDTGKYSDSLVENISGSKILMLEFNHDIDMLVNGPYPQYIKERILGDKGHLSNDMAVELVEKLDSNTIEALLLGHLSRTNNLPELALKAAGKVVSRLHAKGEIIITDQYEINGISIP